MKKAISVILIIAGILALLSAAVPAISVLVAERSIPSSIGIIGGADGPTEIVVSGTFSTGSLVAVAAAGALLLAAGLWQIKARKK